MTVYVCMPVLYMLCENPSQDCMYHKQVLSLVRCSRHVQEQTRKWALHRLLTLHDLGSRLVLVCVPGGILSQERAVRTMPTCHVQTEPWQLCLRLLQGALDHGAGSQQLRPVPLRAGLF